jgi:hypothetical protein
LGYYQGEAMAVERMRALRNEGLGFDRIARRLNSEGVPTRTRQPWHGVVESHSRGLPMAPKERHNHRLSERFLKRLTCEQAVEKA